MAFELSLPLSEKIAELTNDVNGGKIEFPHILVYNPRDLDDLTQGRLKGNVYETAWYFHDTEEAFLDTCEVLSKKFSVEPIYIRTAFWLMQIHYMDCESEVARYHDFAYARRTYGVDEKTYEQMKESYGTSCVADVIRVARALGNIQHGAPKRRLFCV